MKLEKAMAPHSSTLAWEIPWTEEPGELQSMGSRRVGHDWATSLSLFTFIHWRRKWQPTPVFLPGESQGQGSLVGCCLWGCTGSDTTEATQQQQQQQQYMKHSSGGKEGKAILGLGKTVCKCKDCKQGVGLRDLQVSGRLCFCVMAGGEFGSRNKSRIWWSLCVMLRGLKLTLWGRATEGY